MEHVASPKSFLFLTLCPFVPFVGESSYSSRSFSCGAQFLGLPQLRRRSRRLFSSTGLGGGGGAGGFGVKTAGPVSTPSSALGGRRFRYRPAGVELAAGLLAFQAFLDDGFLLAHRRARNTSSSATRPSPLRASCASATTCDSRTLEPRPAPARFAARPHRRAARHRPGRQSQVPERQQGPRALGGRAIEFAGRRQVLQRLRFFA